MFLPYLSVLEDKFTFYLIFMMNRPIVVQFHYYKWVIYRDLNLSSYKAKGKILVPHKGQKQLRIKQPHRSHVIFPLLLVTEYIFPSSFAKSRIPASNVFGKLLEASLRTMKSLSPNFPSRLIIG